ncbi:hypothetical protein BKA66DRAFT_446528 [Pyrenochaeta sp. MPI-SDFR-AT-0127]|nr:hypothetical protein BKA66DRAFT_446528 [Pyrenochaeta sp. MPI-SDFR-AT-0127]
MSSGPPPPLGHPWLANVGNNPNINREPPPPPLNAAPGAQAHLPAVDHQQVVVEQQHTPVYGPPVPIGIGSPPLGFASPFGVGVGAFPPVIPPLDVGIMNPFMYGGYPGGGGPLAPIRAGNFLPGAHSGIGFGLHAGGMPFPPPPPGAIAGVVPPFAPTAPLWAPGGGLAFGNIPTMGVGGVMAGGIMPPILGNLMGAAAPMQARPAPVVHDGNMGFPAQPEQGEITEIAGGIPPGVALIEAGEHTIILQVKGNVCPWLSPGAQFQVEALAMASTTGLNRLIQVCNNGASADDCENMAVTECIELGNGMWEKGQTFKYNDAVSRVLTMKDAGWDNKRNRSDGQSLHIWLHRI